MKYYFPCYCHDQNIKNQSNDSGASAARRAAEQSPIGITGRKRKPMKDFPYGYHG